MILSESPSTEISSDFFQYRRQLQLNLITFFNVLGQAQLLPTSSWLTCLFTIIELLQIASLFFLPNTSWTDANVDVLSKMLSVLRLGFITDSIQYDSMLLWIVYTLIVSILASGIFIGRWIRQFNWVPSSLAKVVLALTCQGISGFLFIPILLLLLNSMKCPSGGCNDSLYWAMAILSSIVLILFTGLILMISLIMIHEQANKSMLNSGPATSAGFYRAIESIVLAVLMLLCTSSRALVIMSSMAAAAVAAYVAYLHTMYQPFYSSSYRKLLAASLWVIFWAAVCKFINSILIAFDVVQAGMLAPLLVGALLLAVCICLICDIRCDNIVIRPNEQLLSPLEYELKIRLLLLADGVNTKSIQSLDIIWNECTTRFPLSFTAYLHRGNFYKLHTRRPYIALQMFNKASSLTNSLIEEILVNRAKLTITNLQLDAEFSRILNHEKGIKRARSLDSAAACSLMAFWEEASLVSPDVHKIQHLMSKLSSDITSAEACYKVILLQFPNDVSILRSYAGFLIDTMNDTVSGQEISLRATDQEFLGHRGSDHSSGVSERSIHVILSTDEKSFGIIKAASQALCRLFGQAKSELEGKHFTSLSFNILKSYYTEMLQRLFQDVQDESNKDTQLKLLAMHSNRSLIVTEIKLHCFIDSDELLIVGELDPVASDDHAHYFLVEIASDDSGPKIIACSLQLSNLIGLSPDFVFHERLPVTSLLPGFSQEYESYLSSKGCFTNLQVSNRQDEEQIFRTLPVTVQMELIEVEGRSVGLVCLKSEPVSVDNLVKDSRQFPISVLEIHVDTGMSSEQQDDLPSQSQESSEADQVDPFQLFDKSESQADSDSLNIADDVTPNGLTPREKLEDDVSLPLSASHRSDDASISSAVTKRLLYSAKRLGLNEAFLRQNRKRDRLKKIRIFLLLIILIAFASAVTLHSSTSVLLSSWISNLRLVQNSGYLRYLLLSIVMMTKRIVQSEEIDTSRDNLVEIANQFDTISNDLFANRMSLSAAHRDLLFSNPLTVQKLIDSQIVLDKVTLWDATRLVVSSSRSITNTDSVSDYDRNAFFLLQNYEMPILRGLNDSAFQYESAGQLTKFKINQMFIALISVSLVLLLIIAVFMTRPDICQVEQDSTNLLIRILQVSPKVMFERRAKAVTRLILLGELESDALYNQRDKARQADDIKSHNRNVRVVIKKLRAVSVHEKAFITMRIAIPIVLLSAYYALFYTVDYNAMGPNLSHSSSLINWSSYEQMSIRRVLLNEFNLFVWNNASKGSDDLIASVNELQRVHNYIVYGDQSANTLNLIRNPSFSTQDNVLFRSACTAQDTRCSNLYNGLLTDGLHVLILDYLRQNRQLMMASNQTWTNRGSHLDQLFTLESQNLEEIVTNEIISLISDIAGEISQCHNMIGLVLLLGFIFALSLTYRLFYSPLTANVAVREKHIDIITRLLPT